MSDNINYLTFAFVIMLVIFLIASTVVIHNIHVTSVVTDPNKVMCFDDWKCDSMDLTTNSDAGKQKYPCRTQNKVPLLSCLLRKGNGINHKTYSCKMKKSNNCLQGCHINATNGVSNCCCDKKTSKFCSDSVKCEQLTRRRKKH